MRVQRNPLSTVMMFLWIVLCGIVVSMCSIRPSYAGDPRQTPTPRPLTVLPPTGGPIYVHPSQLPTGPAVILSPNSLPVYVHPPTSSYGPSTILTPDSGPIYVWPVAP